MYSPQPGALPVEYPAWEGELGGEPDSEMYIGHMVYVCRQIRRVLRPDGTFWLNIGDSYNGSGGAGGDYGPGGIREGQPKYPGRRDSNLQAGDLMMIPARLALALQADGWILRNDDIWAKHPMPEPRKGWRYEQPPCPCVTEAREMHIQRQMAEQGVDRHRIYDKAGTKFKPDPGCPKCEGSGRHGDYELKEESWRRTRSHEFVFQLVKRRGYYSDHYRAATSAGANPLTVMTPSRTNYSGKHFAVFPPALIAPMVHASVPKRSCPTCGKPWAPVVEVAGKTTDRRKDYQIKETMERKGFVEDARAWPGGDIPKSKSTVTGYRPTCECSIVNDKQPRGGPYPPVPGLVLDPFMGSGTTGMVAREFGVNFAGTDISFEYLDEQAKIRTKTGQPSKALDGLPLFDTGETGGVEP